MPKIKTFEFVYMGLVLVVVFSLILTELYGPWILFLFRVLDTTKQSSILFQDRSEFSGLAGNRH